MAKFKAVAAIAFVALVGALLYVAQGTRTPEIDEDNAQAPAPPIVTADLSGTGTGDKTLPEATPHSESIPVAELPPNHPPVTRYSKNIPLDEIARQDAAREAEKQAYVESVADEHWLDSLAKLSEERLPDFFTRVGSIADSLSLDSADTLSDLAKDPRIGKLIEIAVGDNQALRFELHQNVDLALQEWALLFDKTSEGAYSPVPNGALALPLLYYASGDDLYTVGETLAKLVAARQATLQESAKDYLRDLPVTTDFVMDRFSTISSDMIRLSLRSLSENEEYLSAIGPEAAAVLVDFRHYQTAVAQHQQSQIESMAEYFQNSSTERFPEGYLAGPLDLVDLIHTGGNTQLAELDLRYLSLDDRPSVVEIPLHYFELLQNSVFKE